MFCGKTSTEMKLNSNDWNSVEPGLHMILLALSIFRVSR